MCNFYSLQCSASAGDNAQGARVAVSRFENVEIQMHYICVILSANVNSCTISPLNI